MEFDTNYLPSVFALANGGRALCYFNSLMQFLMSMPSFNAYMVNNKDQYNKSGPISVGARYIELFEKHRGETDPERISTDDASMVLKDLIATRKINGVGGNLLYGRQEDLHEGMHFMMEFIGGRVLNLFKMRHRRCFKCNACGDEHEMEHKYYDTTFNLSEEPPHILAGLNTQKKVQDYIKFHVDVPPEYKCEKCNVANNIDANTGEVLRANIVGSYRLARLSEIIILVFNKDNKTTKYFPPKLEFKSNPTKSIMRYKLVAQVEHFGNHHSGHYVVRALRRKPIGFDNYRQNKFQHAIASRLKILERKQIILRNKLKRINDSVNSDGQMTQQLRTLREQQEIDVRNQLTHVYQDIRELQSTDLDQSDNEIVFLFNDNHPPRYIAEGFVPTVNTYMVAYHCY